MARIRSKEELFRHRFVNRHLNHWSSNFFFRRSTKEKYIYIYYISTLRNCISMIMARKLSIIKGKRGGEKGSRNIAVN